MPDKYGALQSIDEVNALEREYLTPRQASGILKCTPYAINIQVKLEPESLGFPVIILGSRVRIPKKPFIKFLTGE
jgi:hypothetical protein